MASTLDLARDQRSVAGSDVLVVRPNGTLDAHTAPRFEALVQECLDTGQVRLVVDCSGIDYISSAGLGVFMGFVDEIRDAGGDLRMSGLAGEVAEVFDLLGFSSIFEIFDEADAAAASFAENPGG